MAKKLSDYLAYQQYFNTAGMWEKIADVAKKAGVKVIYGVLLLYYVSVDPNTYSADKAKIYGALGYFILPVDLIPDALPVVGYTDDLAAITWALKAVWDNITPEIHKKAKKKLTDWFGSVKESELKIF